jgi:hypothetical protein
MEVASGLNYHPAVNLNGFNLAGPDRNCLQALSP